MSTILTVGFEYVLFVPRILIICRAILASASSMTIFDNWLKVLTRSDIEEAWSMAIDIFQGGGHQDCALVSVVINNLTH